MVRRQLTPRVRSRLLDPDPRGRRSASGELLARRAGRPAGRRRKITAIAVAVWLVLPTIGLAWVAGAGTANAASPLVEVAGQLPSTHTDRLYIDGTASPRLLYELDPNMGAQGLGHGIRQGDQTLWNGDAGIRILDADTFQPIGDDIDLGSGGTPFTAAVDETDHLLFVDWNPFGAQPSIKVIDPAKHAVTQTITGVGPVSYSVSNIDFDPDTRQLFVESALSRTATVVVAQIALDQALQSGAANAHLVSVPQCEKVASGHSFGANHDAVYVACTGADGVDTHVPEVAQGVYTIPFASQVLDQTSIKFFPVPGGYQFGGAVFDPGSGRMALFTREFGPSGALIFDGAHQAMVGVIGQRGNFQGACVDRRTGRFYTLTDFGFDGVQDAGLIVGELRPTPSPQGLGFPELRGHDDQDVPFKPEDGQEVCDSTGHRLLYKVSSKNEDSTYSYSYIVLTDHIPDYVPPPPPPDPDANTANVPDDPTKSFANYEADGRAFGARATFAGGYSNLILNVANVPLVTSTALTLNPCAPPFQPPDGVPSPPTMPPRPDQVPDPCGSASSNASPATRWFVLGSVGQPNSAATVSLSNASASSAAGGGIRDDATTGDMTRHGTQPDAWPYTTVSCTHSPGSASQPETTLGATATCDPDNGVASGTGNATGFLEIPGAIRVTGAGSDVTTKLDAEAGIIATATAATGAVSIGDGAVEIDDIHAIATSQARGLPGTAKASYTRSVGRLVVAGQVICEPCDVATVVDAINAIPNLNVRAVAPRVDASAITGTPGGYQAAVVRDPWEQRTDEVMNEVSDYDQQVPALRLVVSEDAYQHSAAIIDLAAPTVEAHRGLQPCDFCTLGPTTTTTEEPTTTTTEAPLAPAVVADDETPTTLPPDTTTTTTAAPRSRAVVAVARPIPLAHPSSTKVIRVTKGAVKPATAARPRAILPRIGGAVRQAADQILRGIAVLFASPHRIFELVLVWAVLAVPVYLASRRRLITQRMV